MNPNKLISKLRKAGINASLVHRVQDETMIDVDMSFEELEVRVLVEYCIADAQAAMEFNEICNSALYEAPKVGRMYGGFKPGQLALPPPMPRTTPPKSWVWFDYTARSTLTKGEEARYERISKELQELAKEYKADSTRLESVINRHGYIETPSGARRYPSRRDMGHNDTLR